MYYQLSGDYGDEGNPGEDFAVIMEMPDELVGIYWTTGVPVQENLTSPVIIELDEDDSGPDMPDYFGNSTPACSDKMIKILESAGIDNFELFDIVLKNPVTEKLHDNYKMLNILGLLQAVDMKKSTYDPRSEMFLIEFDEIVIDSKKAKGQDMFRLAENARHIIISEKIKDALDKADLLGIEITPLRTV
jgi:hypothetical protein